METLKKALEYVYEFARFGLPQVLEYFMMPVQDLVGLIPNDEYWVIFTWPLLIPPINGLNIIEIVLSFLVVTYIVFPLMRFITSFKEG